MIKVVTETDFAVLKSLAERLGMPDVDFGVLAAVDEEGIRECVGDMRQRLHLVSDEKKSVFDVLKEYWGFIVSDCTVRVLDGDADTEFAEMKAMANGTRLAFLIAVRDSDLLSCLDKVVSESPVEPLYVKMSKEIPMNTAKLDSLLSVGGNGGSD